MADVVIMLQPIETSSEALIEAKVLGLKIRSHRLKRAMGLVELGCRAGLSASFLSQLETGKVVPTLEKPGTHSACI